MYLENSKRQQLERILTVIFMIIFSIWISSCFSFQIGCRELRQDMLRLHILAQSDSPEDQRLKLLVRDRILAESAGWAGSGTEKQEMMEYIGKNILKVELLAEEALAAEGCFLPVKAELTHSFFDTRVYGERMVPAGWYDALQITIGAGEGRNWWCVLYPPLCLPAAEGEAVLAADFTEEEKAVLSSPPRYQIRFLTVELAEKFWNWLRGQG